MLRICELEKTLSFRHFVKNKRKLELFLNKLAQGLLYIGATRKNKSFSWRERKMKFAKRMERMQASEIRELLKLTAQPDIISFAGGLPAPELFPVEEIAKVSHDLVEK